MQEETDRQRLASENWLRKRGLPLVVRRKRRKRKLMTTAEMITAAVGTPRPLSRASILGPSALTAAVRSIREVEYRPPALQDDSAAVSTTKLTMPAAAGIPIFVKAATNGLTPGLNSVQLKRRRRRWRPQQAG